MRSNFELIIARIELEVSKPSSFLQYSLAISFQVGNLIETSFISSEVFMVINIK